MAIVCKRELEIRHFVPLAYFEVVATAKVAGGQFQMRHAPQDRIVRREIAQDVVNAARTSRGRLPCASRISGKGHPSCMICRRCRSYAGRASAGRLARRSRWCRSSIDRAGQEDRHLSACRGALPAAEPDIGRAANRCRIAGGPVLRRRMSVPNPPIIRKGASGTFYDKGLEGASHHAVIPNVNTIDKLREVSPRLSPDIKNCSTSSRGPIWPP